MLKITRIEDRNILNIRVEGKITENEMEPLLKVMEDKLNHDNAIRLFIEIPSIDRFEPEEIMKSFKFSLDHVKDYLANVDKVAIITDKDWLSNLTRIEDKILPNIDEKAFTFDESEKAVEWLKS